MANPLPGWFPRAPSLRLLPLLALYFLFVLLKARNVFIGDEERYVLGARNILKGFLASEETLFLWNGPGYPLYLVPFVGLGLPLILAKLGNAVFLYLAMVRFHHSLDQAAGAGKSAGAVNTAGGWGTLAVTYVLGIYLLIHSSSIELLMTEGLSAYLVCGAAHHYLTSLRPAGRAGLHSLLAGLHLAGLALTKVFFGYAALAALAAAGAWWVLERWRAASAGKDPQTSTAAGRASLACALALAFCLPYLTYTYSLTGKAFFWSNSGGSQLYCMTLREKELLGDWLNFDAVLTFPDFFHGQAPYYRELARMDYVSRDAAMKAAALRNIKADPRKYFRNWRANMNRMVFGYPVSRYPGSDSELATGNRSFIYAIPFFLALFALPAAWRGRAGIPAGIQACLAFALMSLGGLSLVSSFPRIVFPLLPLLGLWLGAVRMAAGRKMEVVDWKAGAGVGKGQATIST